MTKYVAALDQGTTSTRFMIFDHQSNIIAVDRMEHRQIFPEPGWVEHDPMEILDAAKKVIEGGLAKSQLQAKDLSAIGVTNQRETTIVWNRETGKPIYNAIVWQDVRTDSICRELAALGGQDRFREQTGLPLATYFSGPKIKWMLDNVAGAREQADRGELLFGNVDSWLIWNLIGVHITDVTNASRTMLMNLRTLDWDESILNTLEIPRSMLPEIKSSSEIYGIAQGVLAGVPIAGDLGDQQAALFGQACFKQGEAKNTYGTGCFMLMNTGEAPIKSTHGLLSTLGYKIGDQAAVYALEGSIAITGALVQWLRDNLGMINSAEEVEELAKSVEDNGGVYFVPAFSGLFAPYWRDDARGVITGLTRYANKGHIARAVLEATAFQTAEVLTAMEVDSGVTLKSLKVDGGMVHNDLLMQFQADILDVEVERPQVSETTALGAAYAAGLAVGYWQNLDELRSNWRRDRSWQPAMNTTQRDGLMTNWKKAVSRTFDWVS